MKHKILLVVQCFSSVLVLRNAEEFMCIMANDDYLEWTESID